MASQPFLATIIGIPHIPTVTEINVRAGAGTSFAQVFRAQVGLANLRVNDVKADAENKQMANKTYQWFYLTFPDGRVGWVRDDLINVQGDGTPFGYPIVTQPTLAFNLTRRHVLRPGEEITPAGTTAPVVAAVGVVTQPAVTVTAAPTTTAVAPSAPTPASAPTTPTVDPNAPAIAICMSKGGANVRPGPGTQFDPPVFRLPYLAEATILEVAKSQTSGDPFRWIKLSYQGREGWMREDFARLKGNYEKLGLGFLDQYPNPTVNTWWIRDFNLDPNFAVVHHGWDHAGNIGEPILAGPKGGLVIKVAYCNKCGVGGRSTVDAGYSLSDSRVLSDPEWNYGYGHYVNVMYHHSILPLSTQQRLAEQGKAGWHLFVNHAHLSRILVAEGQTLAPNQPLGLLGNSGNSSGPHLHLEVRAHHNERERNWAAMKAGLMSPAILFRR
jgi:uncharacterized protein YraI